MRIKALVTTFAALWGGGVCLADSAAPVTADAAATLAQRVERSEAAAESGFSPQSPRDLTVRSGSNAAIFDEAPVPSVMNLCNIHFHHAAEHRGGEFTSPAGTGNDHGVGGGFRFDGTLTEAELRPVDYPVGNAAYGTLGSGDTIEIHYVYSTASVTPGATLGSCLGDAASPPRLRVEGFVFVLVNDDSAADLRVLTEVAMANGYHQAVNMPRGLGTAVSYPGSTTGPGYNEVASPFQVTWSVYLKVLRVSIASVAGWLEGNAFDEDHAHGVRNLVTDPALLSTID